MAFPLSSPGHAVAARSAWEASLAGVARRELRRYLAAVERDARAADPGATPLTAAAGEGFSWWQVIVSWGVLAHALVDHIAALQGRPEPAPFDEAAPYLSPAPDDQFLSGVYARLMEHPAPRLALDTVTVVLAVAAERLWSRARVARELARVLDPTAGTALRRLAPPDQGDAPPHPFTLPELTEPADAWAALPGLIARAEATGAYNVYAIDQLARAGFTHKRWVTRHDERVRPTHRAAEGQTVPLASEFLVGGFALLYPADPAAPAVETAGCRCCVVGVS